MEKPEDKHWIKITPVIRLIESAEDRKSEIESKCGLSEYDYHCVNTNRLRDMVYVTVDKWRMTVKVWEIESG